MNRNTTIAVIVIVVAALIGWIVYAETKAPSYVAPSSTTAGTDSTGGTTPTPAASAPAVATGSAIPTDTTVVMTGSAVPNGAFTTYWYEYGTVSNSLSIKSASQTLGSGFQSLAAPAYVTGLSAHTNYYFRLVAENAYGKVAGTQQSFRTTDGVPPPRGSAPAAITASATAVTRNSANLNGSVDPNQNMTEYWFEYGKTTSLGNTAGFVSAGSGDSKVSVTVPVSGLDPLTTYYFRLNAQNQFGTVLGQVLTFKTAGPASATAPSAVTKNETGVTSTKATLRATVDPNGAETSYWFEYSTDSLLGSVLLSTTAVKSAGAGTSAVSVSADISGLNPNTNYYYRIVAQNSAGTDRGDNESFKTSH